jgi:threonine/homoserine/homoserine lactone efflux protein
MLAILVQGIGYGLAAAAQPGPFQTFLVSQTLNRGWRRALPMALAPLISDGPIIALSLLVLSRVPDGWQRLLNVASGLFLLYLAYAAYLSWRRFDGIQLVSAEPFSYGVLKASLMNALSPGPYLFWSLVTGPILLASWRQAPSLGVGFLVAFYAAMVSSLAAIVLVFGMARKLGPRLTRVLLGVSAIALLGFGLYQLASGLILGTQQIP